MGASTDEVLSRGFGAAWKGIGASTVDTPLALGFGAAWKGMGASTLETPLGLDVLDVLE